MSVRRKNDCSLTHGVNMVHCLAGGQEIFSAPQRIPKLFTEAL